MALLSSSPFFLVVAANSPLKTVADVIAAARQRPNGLKLQLWRPRLIHHLSTELLQKPRQHPDDPHTLQGDAARDERLDCGPRSTFVQRHHLGAAVHPAGHCPRHRRSSSSSFLAPGCSISVHSFSAEISIPSA